MSDFWRYFAGTAGALALGAATTGAVYWATRPEPYPFPVNINEQARECPGFAHACTSCLGDGENLMSYLYDDAQTFYQAFLRGCYVSNNGACLGWRPASNMPYKWLSYEEVRQKAIHFGSGLVAKNLAACNTTRIGMYSQNRVEYIVGELACSSYSMVIVPLYDTLGPEACTYIINQAEIELVVCDTNKKVSSVLSNREQTPELRVIVSVEKPSQQNITKAQEVGIELLSFSDVELIGKKNVLKPNPCGPEDLCTICYTSGTTGDPKGAMITHKNLLSVVGAISKQLETLDIGPHDTMISYLPLAHMYQRMNETCMYMNGARVGFYQGDVKLLMDDIGELRPTVFPTVPRLLNRVFDKVLASVSSSPIKKYLFDVAVAKKTAEIESGVIRKNSLWDKLVFQKVQKSLGGCCRLITTGSAPVSPKVLNFVRCATGAVVLEGYGQTECAAVCTLQIPGDSSMGNVGCPLACNMIRIVDVPDMNYFADNNQGEICVKGPNVFQGYLKMPEKTAEAIDKDGWLHTGDIGMWMSNGTVKIIDRKKNIFKLAQGEYIAPEKIETIYARSSLIAQVYVHGDSLKACVVAVAVPDPDVFPRWAKENLGIEADMIDLCTDMEVTKAVLEDLVTVGKGAGLVSFEQIRSLYLHPEALSIENGLLTPTMKTKRHDVAHRFSRQIDAMYSHLQ